MGLFSSTFLYSAKLNFLNLFTEKTTSLRESKKFEYVNSGDIAAPESHIDESIRMSTFTEARRTVFLSYFTFSPLSLLSTIIF